MTTKQTPMLFSAPMVRALLNGSKTQTRRVVKPQPPEYVKDLCSYHHPQPGHWIYGWSKEDEELLDWCIKSPYGGPGDQIWVKETTVKVEDHGYLGPVYSESEHGRNVIEYGLSPSDDDFTEVEPHEIKLRPSIFMPRSMSRITLGITSIRIERLQDISESDSVAEGIYTDPGCPAYDGYRDLWKSINGAKSWDENPFVWVIGFNVEVVRFPK